MKNQSSQILYYLAMISFFVLQCICPRTLQPHAPDYGGDFMQRAQMHELNIQQTAHTTQSYTAAHGTS